MKKYRIYIILLIFLLPAVYPLLRPDFFHFSDEPNISLIYQMSRALEAGHFPPRWIPDVSYNFGHPLFNFYYPLPFILGALLFQLTGSLISSIKLYFLLTVIVSSLAMYHLLKKHTSSFMAFAGALIYVYTPYRAVNLYVRGAIGELTAFAVVPLVCFFIYRLYEKQSLKNIGLLALFTGLFILSHNLALMIFFPWFFVYGLYLFLKSPKRKKFIRAFGLSLTLGIAIAFFWLYPAVSERHLLYSETPFNYKDHFPFLKQLIYSPFRYGASLPGPDDDVSFQIGIANLLLVFITAYYAIRSSQKGKKILAFLCLSAFGFAVFMMNTRSSFLWETFSLSVYFQFPWRILMFTTFITALMIIFVKSRLLGAILLIIALVNTLAYFVPSEYFKPDDDYYMRRMFANKVISGKSEESPEYKDYSEDFLLLPVRVKERPGALPAAKIESDTALISYLKEVSPYEYVAGIEAEEVSEIVINNYYYPGWRVYLDGKRSDTYPLEPFGNIGLRVPQGDFEIRLIWEETASRRFANYVSLFSLVMIIFMISIRTKKKKNK